MAKYFLGQSGDTERHVLEAFRLSPRDTFAYVWMHLVGLAKLQLGADAEAVRWLRRSIEANRNFAPAHLVLAAALALIGALGEARTAATAGLTLNPGFTIRRHFRIAFSESPTYLAGWKRLGEGVKACVWPVCLKYPQRVNRFTLTVGQPFPVYPR